MNSSFFRSYSSTRTVAPLTHRSHRSPGSTMKTSDTIDSVRHQRIPSTNVQDNSEVYQQVYHDDSSTHGSRTLDSRFSRDKYDLSDDQKTDEDEDEPTHKSFNGISSSSPPTTHVYRSSEPFHVEKSTISESLHPIDQIDQGKNKSLSQQLNRIILDDQ